MTIVKKGNRNKSILKNGREYVAPRVFDTKRRAKAWLARERMALAGGVDVQAGRQRVRIMLPQWLNVRGETVAQKTLTADESLMRLVPTWLAAMSVSAVGQREIARSIEELVGAGYSAASASRYRASLSGFFAWCVREKYILANPVDGVRVPTQTSEPTEMRPWSESGLESAFDT